MKYIKIYLLFLVLGILAGLFIWGFPVKASVLHTRWGEWHDTTVCIAKCDTTVGTKNQERTCVVGGDNYQCGIGTFIAAHWDYTDPICPLNYHAQNSGNWNERCHRNNNSIHPEHKAPTGCPEGFIQNEVSCRKWIAEVSVPADKEIREVKCETELIACEPEVTPTPMEEKRQPDPGSCNGCGEQPSAWMCPNGKVVLLPKALFVHRTPTEATVTWFRTAGDEATIVYRVSGHDGWNENSVRDLKTFDWNSFTIQALDPNTAYDFGVYQHNGCSDGSIAIATVVDGPKPVTYGFSHVELVR